MGGQQTVQTDNLVDVGEGSGWQRGLEYRQYGVNVLVSLMSVEVGVGVEANLFGVGKRIGSMRPQHGLATRLTDACLTVPTQRQRTATTGSQSTSS